MTGQTDRVEITLADGRRIHVRVAVAARVRGVDADGDAVVPLGTPDMPLRHDDGSDYLIALTPCCNADGKGSVVSTGVVCRACYREVASKYGGPSQLAVPVASI
jgi:hypothetical protein